MSADVGRPRWTDEQLALIAKYGVCSTCGAPRDARVTRDDQGRPIQLDGVCTADESHPAWD